MRLFPSPIPVFCFPFFEPHSRDESFHLLKRKRETLFRESLTRNGARVLTNIVVQSADALLSTTPRRPRVLLQLGLPISWSPGDTRAPSRVSYD